MRILAIDPGYDRLGVAVIEKQNQQEVVLFSTCIKSSATHTFSERLHTIGSELERIITNHQPTLLAVETLFFNKNVKTALQVAHARGVIMYVASTHKLAIMELSPQQIKVAVTGYGNSDKQAVTMMVKQLARNVPESVLDDEYDAIAVGITALAHYR